MAHLLEDYAEDEAAGAGGARARAKPEVDTHTARMVQAYLMNVTPTGQYLPGDLVQVPTRAYDGNRNYQGVTVILDRNGSTIRVRTGNPIPLAGKNSGNHLVVPSRWRFVIRAWRSPAADDHSGPGCGGKLKPYASRHPQCPLRTTQPWPTTSNRSTR